MKDTKIELRWTYQDQTHSKLLAREDLMKVFEGLVKGFWDDNEISKIFVETIIPNADSITINKDLNITQDIPYIVYDIDCQMHLLKIIRYHKIVWAILDKYCTE